MSPTTSAPAARPSLAIYLPLLGLTWALSVCVMGIGAALCAFYQNRFPSSEVGGVVRQLTFAGAWMTLWGSESTPCALGCE